MSPVGSFKHKGPPTATRSQIRAQETKVTGERSREREVEGSTEAKAAGVVVSVLPLPSRAGGLALCMGQGCRTKKGPGGLGAESA